MAKEVMLTPEGVAKLEEKLDYLKTVKRPEVTERIKQALAFGDLSENAEYDEAKNEQAFVEGEIISIENMLRSAKLIDEDDLNTDVVNVGNTVRVLDKEFDEEIDYVLCGSTESDPNENRISNESPIGAALMGSHVGDTVQVETPGGIVELEVLSISK
ncbi:transcription elongation factor GreA [Christensenellaceae bacterium NSJ-44]|jgi:transcription elongation factor GreA|uniref:Transcription elongation factor GreA n=1 Tax=Luoshenia tenuis TaxID=2763654 RepID=A0A926CZI1_9FIRM|nr:MULTISPECIES: transcription elongation factor GreA [Clostridia]MBC8528476.1 transcription elongation factor GreA [Luoshenia tenuis]SCJ55933.1 Transcript cleavage factor greA [uncultured Clostridium sp.]